MNFHNTLNENIEAHAAGCMIAEQSVLQWH
jgi:hypothetical protein